MSGKGPRAHITHNTIMRGVEPRNWAQIKGYSGGSQGSRVMVPCPGGLF